MLGRQRHCLLGQPLPGPQPWPGRAPIREHGHCLLCWHLCRLTGGARAACGLGSAISCRATSSNHTIGGACSRPRSGGRGSPSAGRCPDAACGHGGPCSSVCGRASNGLGASCEGGGGGGSGKAAAVQAGPARRAGGGGRRSRGAGQVCPSGCRPACAPVCPYGCQQPTEGHRGPKAAAGGEPTASASCQPAAEAHHLPTFSAQHRRSGASVHRCRRRCHSRRACSWPGRWATRHGAVGPWRGSCCRWRHGGVTGCRKAKIPCCCAGRCSGCRRGTADGESDGEVGRCHATVATVGCGCCAAGKPAPARQVAGGRQAWPESGASCAEPAARSGRAAVPGKGVTSCCANGLVQECGQPWQPYARAAEFNCARREEGGHSDRRGHLCGTRRCRRRRRAAAVCAGVPAHARGDQEGGPGNSRHRGPDEVEHDAGGDQGEGPGRSTGGQ
mmetsp:Transcript_76377/g.210913  ORF Transcript_76377/g.210913 Transcript_76377/m.210913 type:complete len:445 (+) Transcript_76377:996-2330(+)